MPTGEVTAQQKETEGEAQGITIDDLLNFVALACQPKAPPQLVEQVHGTLLTGERHPDLSALPPELASKIREHLATLS